MASHKPKTIAIGAYSSQKVLELGCRTECATSSQLPQSTRPRLPQPQPRAGVAPVVSRGRVDALAHRGHPVTPCATGGMPASTIHPLVFILVLVV